MEPLSKLCAVAGAVVCFVGFVSADASAQPRNAGRWEQLGCQKVGFLTDRDVIKVGRAEGRFKAIRLKVSGNAVHIEDLKVVYANGEPDDLQVRSEIRAGQGTRALDLKGRERAIRQIDLVYRSKPSFKGQATVCAEGLD